MHCTDLLCGPSISIISVHSWKLIRTEHSVKNGFSDLTKVQMGSGSKEKRHQNEHARGSPRGCHEENKLGWVCLQQRRLTPKGLARVMNKSKSKMQTVTMYVSVEKARDHVVGEQSNMKTL